MSLLLRTRLIHFELELATLHFWSFERASIEEGCELEPRDLIRTIEFLKTFFNIKKIFEIDPEPVLALD